ncbi:MAG: hypothetical protein HFG78_08400 [Hungatella sp.]|nr:hypothetical protein [Hungatella sp.]MCI9502261.1 hypothetical protein [Hungatella sp.]
MNRLKTILKGVIGAFVMTLAICSQAFAARIAFSDPSAEAGGEVTVSMKITATGNETINSSNVMLTYDPQALQFLEGTGASGDAGSLRVVGTAEAANSTELSFSLKFKALKAGNTSISVSTQEVYNGDGQLVTVEQQGNSVVSVSGAAGASDNAALSDLQISPGTLTPAFSPDVDSYTAVVGQDVETVTVSALVADESATVSVSGNEGLQMGDNEIVCTVVAADGQTTRTYRVVVTRTEAEVDGEAPVVSQVELRTPERNITVLSADDGPEIPEGFVRCSVTINGQAVYGWIWNDEANPGADAEYCIFYAMNENGETGFYRYDLTEKTLQRYFRDPSGGADGQTGSVGSEEYESLLRDYEIRFWIIMGLIALAVILLIVIIVLVAGRGQRDDFIERREDEDNGWDEERPRGQRLTREEQYLRDLEEEEEAAEREEDLAFVRRVQTGNARERAGRSGTPAPVRSGQTGPVPVTRGTGPVPGPRQPGSPAGISRPGGPNGRPQAGGQPGMEGTRRLRPVNAPMGTGGGRPGGAPGPMAAPPHEPDRTNDDDFEIIDLE